MNDKRVEKMKTETGEQISPNQEYLRQAEIADIESQLSVGDYLVSGTNRQKVTAIFFQSELCSITVVLEDGSKAGWTRLKKEALETGRCKIVRCSQPDVADCDSCSLSNYGRDCSNNKI